ncbi:MAG: hypothetical protein HOV79_03370 [Hamadaea sp.]|nr:hypothetical protein [Hamadaea sp.]
MLWVLLVAGRLTLAGVLGVAAAGKLRAASFQAFRRSLPATLGIPTRYAGLVAVAVVAVEAVLAVALAVAVAVPPFGVAAIAATVLFAAFTAAIAVMLRRGVRTPCHCFGAGARPPGRGDLVRNVALTVLAVAVAVVGGSDPPPPSVVREEVSMPLLIVLVLILTVVSVGNAAVSVFVLRTLREQSRALKVSIEGVANPEPIMKTGGDRVGDFAATTVDGEPVVLQGDTLIGFVSPTCPACAESLPGYLARAELAGGRDRVLTVVLGVGEETRPLVERVAPVSRVILEPERGPVSRAFGVTGFPAFALLSDDTVVASHFVLDKIFEPVA